MIVSVHIPKTAGSSFREGLRQRYGERLLLDYDDRPLSTSISHRWQRLKSQRKTRLEADLLIENYHAIHGHFLVSKYVWLGNRIALCAFFRDPVERLLSHHSYWSRRNYSKNSMRLKFNSMRSKFVDTGMTVSRLASLPRQRGIYALFTANLPIERFSFVGLTEEYETSLQLFRAMFDVDIQAKCLNINDGPSINLDRHERAMLKDKNRENYLVYDSARRRFEGLCRQYL